MSPFSSKCRPACSASSRIRSFITQSPHPVEKFAKLIIKECEQVSLKNSHRDDDMGAIIARNIKQYFRVE